MKELNDLVSELNTDEIKKGAGLGAGIGALLSLGKGSIAKNALIGAGVGLAASWALDKYQQKTVHKDSPVVSIEDK